MKVQVGWLRELVDLPVEPAKLADDLTLVGLAVDGVEGAGDAAVLDIDVTTNRVDCMNVHGIAREASVIYARTLKPLALDFPESGAPAAEAWTVEIEAPDLCPRFCGRVLDVRIGPSPAWIRERLEAVGVRPINNVVDLTNYVMMEMGQPMHAFDLAKIPDRRLIVRWNRPGEKLTTLDGQERTLAGSTRIGVIGGTAGGLGLAGVMGGASSEVSESTRTIALEAAYWDPPSIRRGAKALGMHTEASHRFERGADPEAPPVALARMAHLMAKIGAGTVWPGLIDRRAAPPRRVAVSLRPERIQGLVGTDVPAAESRRILDGLGFRLEGADRGPWSVEVPTWRGDVSREVDLVEEVARHHGLDGVPSTIPPATRVEGLRPAQRRDRTIREALAGAGLTEVITYAFVGEEPAEGVGPRPEVVRLANPLSTAQNVLRNQLVFPGLVAALRHNLRQGRRDVALFEVGRVFHGEADSVREFDRLGILLAGRTPHHWSPGQGARPVDFFDLKGVLERLFEQLGVAPPEMAAASGSLAGVLHPGQAVVLAGGKGGGPVEFAGAIHPELAARFELKDPTFVAEIDPDRLDAAGAVRARALPRFPAVDRDLSVLVPRNAGAQAVTAAIREAAGPLLRDVRVVDRYDRPPVPPDRVSLTLALTYQDPARTLTGEEVQEAMERVVAALRPRGWDIRGE